ELLLVVDDDRVQHTDASEGGELTLPEVVVLEIAVLEANGPAPIVLVGVVRRVLLLKDVGGDADARAITGRHAEGQIDPLDIKLVEILRLRIGAVLVVAEKDAGEVD